MPFPVKERLGVFLSTKQEINIEVLKSLTSGDYKEKIGSVETSMCVLRGQGRQGLYQELWMGWTLIAFH